MKRLIILGTLLTVSSAAFAIDAPAAQAVINSAGESCPSVTAARVIAQSEARLPIFAVACSNGGRYVLQTLPDDRLKFIAKCSTAEALTSLKCF